MHWPYVLHGSQTDRSIARRAIHDHRHRVLVVAVRHQAGVGHAGFTCLREVRSICRRNAPEASPCSLSMTNEQANANRMLTCSYPPCLCSGNPSTLCNQPVGHLCGFETLFCEPVLANSSHLDLMADHAVLVDFATAPDEVS